VSFVESSNHRSLLLRSPMQINGLNATGGIIQDQLRCKVCGKTESPLWRKGPEGPK
ncbi:white collar 2 type of transcription factor, partial [Sarracenia purpurea var. burkii]